MNSKQTLSAVLALTASLLLPTRSLALTPGEQADAFHARGRDAEKRGDLVAAANCYNLALRAKEGHRGAQTALAVLAKRFPKSMTQPEKESDAAVAQTNPPPVLPAKNPPPAPPGAVGPSNSADTTPELFSWTNTSGKTIKAAFVRLEGSEAVLKTAEGKEFRYPIASLNPASRAQAQKLGGRLR